MDLRAKQGRNQKGLSFASGEDEAIEDGIYRIFHDGNSMLIEVRVSSSVPPRMIVLDHRIFSELSCQEDSAVKLEAVPINIPRNTHFTVWKDSSAI